MYFYVETVASLAHLSILLQTNVNVLGFTRIKHTLLSTIDLLRITPNKCQCCMICCQMIIKSAKACTCSGCEIWCFHSEICSYYEICPDCETMTGTRDCHLVVDGEDDPVAPKFLKNSDINSDCWFWPLTTEKKCLRKRPLRNFKKYI